MARFYPIYVRRSDGKLEVVSNKGKRKEFNQPTAEQTDQKPDKNGVSDFYREVAADEVKHLDWRRKLGGMLARELDWRDKSGAGVYANGTLQRNTDAYSSREAGYILVTFPENFRLYEHVKKTEKDGKTEVKSKTHAAGGNDRQDAYLYGHPHGRKKRYRSPADFFPHLLWLCTDESGDVDNCSCKLCCPEELENLIPGAKAIKSEKSVKMEPESRVSALDTRQTGPAMTTRDNPQALKPRENPKPTQNQIEPQRQLIPKPLPQRRSLDQQIDSKYASFKYRAGEVCWFRRGQAWGLGVVLRRYSTHSTHNYVVQPLSHPFQQQAPVTKSTDDEMRPWLAWSVPRYTYSGLNDLPDTPRYETIDWQAVTQGRYGNEGDLDVDGSILAAKSIDCSYTPFKLIHTLEPEPGVAETHFEGMYLGAELIWIGEPIRLAFGSGTDVMVVHSIVERRRVAATTNQTQEHSIYLIGDIYCLTAVSHSDPTIPTPASPNNNPHLPQRMNQDLAHRNARSIQTRHVANYWRLISTQARIDLNSVKGRWYEAFTWLPILQLDAFKAMEEKGDIRELSLYMNARGDCLQANRNPALAKIPRLNIRRDTRREALGRAIPKDAEIIEGIDPPIPTNVDPALGGTTNGESMDIDPRFDTAEDLSHPSAGADGLDQFMNLDAIATHDATPTYGRGYSNHSSGGPSNYF